MPTNSGTAAAQRMVDAGQVLAKECAISGASVVLQLVVAVAFFATSLWAASLLLEPLQLIGITTVPPGIAYVDYDARL